MEDVMSLISIKRPSMARAKAELDRAVSQKTTVIVVGRCLVRYSGRAKSKIELGERLLLIKGDGSVMVHRPTGYSPVNWQPPGCLFRVDADRGRIRIKAVRSVPRETLDVEFNRISLLAAMGLKDDARFSLYADEEDMQRAVLMNPQLVERGFHPISYEKKVEPGFVDVYGIDDKGRFVVVEIKRSTAGREAVYQLERYINSIAKMVGRPVRGILLAPGLAKGALPVIESLGLEFKAVSPERCAELLPRKEEAKISDYT